MDNDNYQLWEQMLLAIQIYELWKEEWKALAKRQSAADCKPWERMRFKVLQDQRYTAMHRVRYSGACPTEFIPLMTMTLPAH